MHVYDQNTRTIVIQGGVSGLPLIVEKLPSAHGRGGVEWRKWWIKIVNDVWRSLLV